uniref:EF-hand domain-containing protein KIAA0494 n=1 Tax=Lygus hesperus TaxID=30085 RepID=A0A0A9X5D6_LYGHE
MVRWGQDSIQLLKAETDSSDSSSGSPTAKPSTAVRRPRFYRARSVTHTTHPFLVKEHVGTILSLACIIVLLVWIILLTVVSTKLYEKVFEVQELTNRISAGSQGVPEEIQKCHSLSRQLQNNQTLIFSHIETLTQRLYNFSMLISSVQGGLHEVENRLKGSPELVNVPSHLQSLTTSIASLGSGLEDMKTTTGNLHEAQEAIQKVIDKLNNNITGINVSIVGLNNTVTKQLGSSNCSQSNHESNEKLVSSILNQLSPNISKINESLSKRIDWVAEDQKKDYKTISDLQETSANLSSQLISLRDDVLHLSTNYSTLNSQMANLKENVEKIPISEGNSNSQSRKQEILPNPITPIHIKEENGGGTMTNSSMPIIPPV